MNTYSLHITKKCNMNCYYCYEKDKISEYSWDDIKKSLDMIISKDKEFNLEFLGGEPTLELELLKKTIDYLQKQNIKVNQYFLTTNGVLVDDRLIDLLLKNSNLIWASSLDGTPRMNNLRICKDGHNSYKYVIDSYNKLKEVINDKQIHIHMTIHPYNVTQIVKGVKHLYELGIRNIHVGIIETTIEISREFCHEYIRQHLILQDMIIENKFVGLNYSPFCQISNIIGKYYIEDDRNSKVLFEKPQVRGELATFDIDVKTSIIKDTIIDLHEIVYMNYQNRLKE